MENCLRPPISPGKVGGCDLKVQKSSYSRRSAVPCPNVTNVTCLSPRNPPQEQPAVIRNYSAWPSHQASSSCRS